MEGQSRRIGDGERALAGELICRLFQTVSRWEAVDSILFYHPLQGEPDIRPLMARALEEGKAVLLPRFDPQTRSYHAARIGSPGRDLRAGKFGVMEPTDACATAPLEGIDQALVPGVAFDAAGRRLGRGAGYYDRILERTKGDRVGIAFDWQMVAKVPEETHDVRMTGIITPSRRLICDGA